MKRFFTKKSVAFILATTIIFVGFFSFSYVLAADELPPTPEQAMKIAAKNEASAKGLSLANLIGSAVGKAIDGIAGSTINIVTSVIAIFIQFITIPIASICLAIAGTILDFTIQYTIYGSGFASMTSSIDTVWVLLRDTANIIFIFALLYAAIQQIIRGVVAKQMLTSVIIAAILINFSLFITKVVIDAGNLVAVSLYDQVTMAGTGTSGNAIANLLSQVGNSVKTGTQFNSTLTSKINLSGILMDSLHLTTIYDTSGVGANDSPIASFIGVGAVINAFTGLILILITTFVFVALAALLIGRFLMLIILMATSPMGFVGDIIPGFSNVSKDWWKSLQNQILIAPAIMFFMLLTIKLSMAVSQITPKTSMTVIFNFFVVAYLLLKSVSLTKSLSGAMGGFVDKITSAATGVALGVATGGSAFIARQTIGRGATALSSKYGERLEALGAKSGVMGRLANVANTGIKGTAKSTFDMRNTTILKSTLEQTSKAGMNIEKSALEAGGKYGKGTGYTGMIDERKKKAEEQAKEYAKSAAKTAGEDKKKIEGYDKQISELEAKISLETDPYKENDLRNQLKAVKDEKIKNTSAGIEEEIKAAAKALSQQRLSGKDITVEIQNKEQQLEKVQHVDFMADPVIAKFEKDKKKKKNEIEAKKAELNKAAGTVRKAQIQAEIDKLEDDVDIIDKNIKPEQERVTNKAAAEKKIIEKDLNDLKLLNDSIISEATKDVEKLISFTGSDTHKFLLERKNMKQNYADSQRDSILNMLKLMTTAEREALAKTVEKVNYDAEKAKEEADRKKFIKEMQEEMKNSGTSTP